MVGLLGFANILIQNGFTTVQTTAPAGTGKNFIGAGTRQVFVSSSTGNDSTGDGTQALPFATALHAATFIRNGSPDQLLFKCGDTWTNDTICDSFNGRFRQSGVAPTITAGTYTSGPTMTGPILIGSYGAGARPIFSYTSLNTPGDGALFFDSATSTDGTNVVIQGLSFQADCRNPASGSYVGTSSAGGDSSTIPIAWNTGSAYTGGLMLVEDCVINYFVNGIIFQGPTTGTSPNVTPVLMPINVVLRRNIITNSYNGSGHSQGMGGTVGIQNLYDIENFWDHNGWNSNAGLLALTPGTGATIFNRNLYDGNEGITQAGTITRVSQGSIHARGSSNTQFRCGGNIADGLFVNNLVQGVALGENQGTDSQSLNVNNNTPGPCSVQRCVVVGSAGIPTSNAQTAQPGGSGIALNNIHSTTINQCIICNNDTSSGNSVAINWQPTQTNVSDMAGNVVTNTIIYKINTAFTSTITPTQVDVSSGTIAIDLTGTNSAGYPQPNPTASGSVNLIDDYWHSLGNAIVNNNAVDFLTQCASRAGGTWDRRYSAYGANQYIQQSCFGTSYHS